MRFEWDSRKAASNCLKHGVTFEQAVEAFADPHALVVPDVKHSTLRETRQWWLGTAQAGLLLVVFTVREPGGILRIISARRAHAKERLLYESQEKSRH